jgi:protein ImuB
LPGLAPAVVHRPPLVARVLDRVRNPVSVSSRGTMSACPAWVVVGDGPALAIGSWSGPWPLEERWWDAGGRRRARLQVCTTGGGTYLLAREKGHWWVEATYD